jgi:hypothetical protein
MLVLAACHSLQTPIPEPSKTSGRTEAPAIQTMTPTRISSSNPTKSFVLTSEALILKDLGFFSGFPCAAPCFLGVTPGETPFDYVVDILEEHLYYPVWVCTRESPDGIIGCSLSGTADIIRVSPDPTTKLVNGIGYAPSPQIDLGAIIGHFGDPDHVYIWDAPAGEPVIEIYLYYDTIQTIIILKEIDGLNYEVTMSSEVVQIFFLDENEYLDHRSLAQDSWKGYGAYP